MQDFGSGDTSSNLVGGIKTMSWNRVTTLLGRLINPLSYLPQHLHSPMFSQPSNPSIRTTRFVPVSLPVFLTEEDAALISEFTAEKRASVWICVGRANMLTFNLVGWRRSSATSQGRHPTNRTTPENKGGDVSGTGVSPWR